MSKWHSSLLVSLVILLGIVVEIDNAYKRAMDISNIALPATQLIGLPEAFHNSPIADMPIVREFDGMTLTSGAIMWMSN